MCGGLMVPIRVEQKKDDFIIWHRCEVCGHEHPNRRHAQDDMTALQAIARLAAGDFKR